MLNSWTTQNRITPQDCKDLATKVLEADPHSSNLILALDKVGDSEKRSKSFTKIIQEPKEVITHFFSLQRPTLAVNRIVSDSKSDKY